MLRRMTWKTLVVGIACGICSFIPVRGREWTDVTGKFKVEAELVAVRSGKVFLEKPDGSVITVPLDKLSAGDQEFLKSKETPPAQAPASLPAANPFATAPPTAFAPPPPVAAPVVAPITAQGAELASQVEKVLRVNCYRCHGEDGTSEGGFNFVLNLEKLARTVVKPKNSKDSLLYERMAAKDETAMPPAGETQRPSPSEIALVKSWIDSGALAPAAAMPREFISNDTIVKHILADVRAASERSRRFLRYFTLTHLHNAGVSEDELQTYRNAFTKLINSLSWNRSLVNPHALDPARTVFRIDMRECNWTGEIWESIEKANPYFLSMNTPDALACNEATQTEMPYVRIDWFVFAASKPPLYHKVLQVPETDAELEQMLRVNVGSNIDQEKAIRAAFNRSGVSQHNRMVEWHQSPYGSYWKSYDFGGSTGRQNLFEHPLGPGTSGDSFQHDGGELIFSLPNGLQGYMLVDGAGRRIDQGPTNIVSDPKQADRTVTNGVSCMSCHYAGVIPKLDEVGPVVRANPKAFANSADILALYRKPEELNRVLGEDAERFAGALKQIGISNLSRSGEPISVMATRFQQEIDLPMVAAEFGLMAEDLNYRLDSTESTARALAPLRVPGGSIKRDLFVTVFGQAAMELKLVSSVAQGSGLATRSTATGTRPTPITSGTTPALGTVRLSENSNAGEICRFEKMGWGIKSLAFSPAGNLLAAGKMDRALWLFDVPRKTRLQSFEDLEILQAVECCLFTPTGSHLLVAGYTGHITIYEVTREGLLRETGQFAGHSDEVTCMAISADGKFVVSGGDEKKLRFWEIATGQERGVFPGFEGKLKACQIAKNGRSAMATDGSTLLQIDLMKREVTRNRKLNNSWATGQAAAFSADGNFVAASDGKKIRLWNLGSTGEMPTCEGSDLVWSLAFTPDSNRLLAGTRGKVEVWDFKKQRKIYTQATAGSGYIQCFAVAPDSKHFAAIPSSAGQDLQVFRLPP
jgi:mono/diheme cytochrome c family protein